MFTVEINGRNFDYEKLSDIAEYCFTMAHAKREQANSVVQSRPFYEGQAGAYGKLGVMLTTVRLRGYEPHVYLAELQGLVDASRKSADDATADLRKAEARIAELEQLLLDVDHIGDASYRKIRT